MENVNVLDEKNLIVMKLLHYFIIERNYNPIILQGADNEIWLENMDSDYKIIRIVSNHIHNKEQLNFDILKTKHIAKKIKRKTFSLNMNVLSIFTDVSEYVTLKNEKNINCIYIDNESDIEKYDSVTDKFPDITKKLKFTEEGMQLFIKITSDINSKNKKEQKMAEDIFKKKIPIITYILIAINVLIFLYNMFLTKDNTYIIAKFGVYKPYILQRHEFYRLITGTFIHNPTSIFHILFNCYALYIFGSQLESFMGKAKYLIIYFYSALLGSLFSIMFSNSISIGASGAIFGLMGSLIYFGYHYRVYLSSIVKSQIIPIIAINLLFGFATPGVDSFAHIGGLIGGFIITIGVGVKYKSSKFEMINGIITSIMLVGIIFFLLYRFN